MKPQKTTWLAWFLWGGALALLIVAVVLEARMPRGSVLGMFGFPRLVVLGTVALAFSTAGAVMAARRPENAVGWLSCGIGFLMAVSQFAHVFAVYGLFVYRSPGLFPVARVMAWIQDWLLLPSWVLLIAFLLLLFPTGKLPSPRWRPLAWGMLLAAVALAVGRAFGPHVISLNYERQYHLLNPFIVPAVWRYLRLVPFVVAVGAPLAILAVGVSAAVTRFLVVKGEERQQLKWLALAGSCILVGAAILIGSLNRWEPGWDVGSAIAMVGIIGLPLSMAIAILRYRLYDIDLIINRTLVYSALSLVLALTYFGGVVLFQSVLMPLTQGSEISVAGSTLVVAGIFQPARRRIQDVVDRRFYRRKYDTERTLEAFSAKLRDEMELDTLQRELQRAVQQTVQPARVSLWLRSPTPGDQSGPTRA